VALAGFSEKDISVESERNLLTISANKSSKEDRKYSYKGISNKNFSRNWQLGDNVEVESVNFADGLLTVTLLKELPDNQKHKKHF
jgi:molecular chaperone IbpA